MVGWSRRPEVDRLQQQLGQARELLADMRRGTGAGSVLLVYADRLAAIVGED